MTANQRITVCIGLFTMLSASAVTATTIVSTDLGNGGFLELFGGFSDEVGWHQTGTFTGVSVAAEIDPGGDGTTPSTESGTAFLTDAIGPGTTAGLNQIATTSFSVTGLKFNPVDDVLFSGLTLGPGSYYLILTASGAQPGGWEITGTGITPVTAPGVTDIDLGHEPSSPAPYLPASNFNVANGNPTEFSVTGTAVTTVPEPATLTLTALGLAGAVARARRRRVISVSTPSR